MTTPIIVIIIATLVVLLYIARLNRQRLKYRKLWIQAADALNSERGANTGGVMLQLSIAKQSAQHWNKNWHHAEEENAVLRKRLAKGQREFTQCLETIDGLLHGDTRCVNGHRFYAPPPEEIKNVRSDGPSIFAHFSARCPHCGADEAKESESPDEVIAAMDEENAG